VEGEAVNAVLFSCLAGLALALVMSPLGSCTDPCGGQGQPVCSPDIPRSTCVLWAQGRNQSTYLCQWEDGVQLLCTTDTHPSRTEECIRPPLQMQRPEAP
jgi:hypothetical protein